MAKKEEIINEQAVQSIQEEVKEDKKGKKEITCISDLPGVGAATAEKLNDAGFSDLISIGVASPAEIVEIAGVGEAAARKIINAARKSLNMGFESGDELLKRRERVEKISTGSNEFDKILNGGVETNTITEMYGPFASGKTALAHQLAVNVQLPKEKGGASGGVAWIDVESTFRPERIRDMAVALNLDPMEILKNIHVSRVYNSDHQMLMVDRIEEIIKSNNLNIKLLVVDSLMGHFRSDFSGRGMLADRQQKLNKHIHALQKLADKYNVAVYVTNQVMARPDVFFGDPTEAIGGHVVAHGTGVRVYLRKGKKGTRVAKIIDSPALPENECVFRITEQGIRDADEKGE